MLVKDDNKVLSRRSDDTGEGPDVLTDLLRATAPGKHVKGTSVALSLQYTLYWLKETFALTKQAAHITLAVFILFLYALNTLTLSKIKQIYFYCMQKM